MGEGMIKYDRIVSDRIKSDRRRGRRIFKQLNYRLNELRKPFLDILID